MRHEKLSGETNYIIYGSDVALRMYEESLDTLMAADNCNYDVVRCTPNQPITSLLDDFVLFERYLFIDEQTYTVLQEHLSQKIHDIIGNSRRHFRSGRK